MNIIKVAVNIPSGKLICANDLREEFALPEKENFDINESVGIKQTIEAYAKVGLFHGFCGNSCPGLYLDKNKLTIASLAYDEEKDETIDDGSLGKQIGLICSDLWWFSVADYDEFISRGGKVNEQWDSIVDVEPGRYVLTYDLDYKDNWKELEIFAIIERSDEEITPWKMPEEGAVEEIIKRLPSKYLASKVENIDPPKDATESQLKWYRDHGYNKRTVKTWLNIKTAWKNLPSTGTGEHRYEKVGYKLFGHLFDSEENRIIIIQDIIVNAEQLRNYDYMAGKIIESLELKKESDIMDKEETDWLKSLPRGKDGEVDIDSLTEEQKERREKYLDGLLDRIRKFSTDLEIL